MGLLSGFDLQWWKTMINDKKWLYTKVRPITNNKKVTIYNLKYKKWRQMIDDNKVGPILKLT